MCGCAKFLLRFIHLLAVCFDTISGHSDGFQFALWHGHPKAYSQHSTVVKSHTYYTLNHPAKEYRDIRGITVFFTQNSLALLVNLSLLVKDADIISTCSSSSACEGWKWQCFSKLGIQCMICMICIPLYAYLVKPSAITQELFCDNGSWFFFQFNLSLFLLAFLSVSLSLCAYTV